MIILYKNWLPASFHAKDVKLYSQIPYIPMGTSLMACDFMVGRMDLMSRLILHLGQTIIKAKK